MLVSLRGSPEVGCASAEELQTGSSCHYKENLVGGWKPLLGDTKRDRKQTGRSASLIPPPASPSAFTAPLGRAKQVAPG